MLRLLTLLPVFLAMMRLAQKQEILRQAVPFIAALPPTSIEAFLEPLHFESVLASIASILQAYVNAAHLRDVPAGLDGRSHLGAMGRVLVAMDGSLTYPCFPHNQDL